MPRLSFPRRAMPALLLALAGLVAHPAAARAAAGKPERARPVRPAEPEVPGAWTAVTAPAADCTRARRKLWQPGEGWIVKTVTTCR